MVQHVSTTLFGADVFEGVADAEGASRPIRIGRRRLADCPGPNIGSEVGPYLPFANVFGFLDVQRPCAVYAMPWGERGSLVEFAVVAAVVFVATVYVVDRRDARSGWLAIFCSFIDSIDGFDCVIRG